MIVKDSNDIGSLFDSFRKILNLILFNKKFILDKSNSSYYFE